FVQRRATCDKPGSGADYLWPELLYWNAGRGNDQQRGVDPNWGGDALLRSKHAFRAGDIPADQWRLDGAGTGQRKPGATGVLHAVHCKFQWRSIYCTICPVAIAEVIFSPG